MTKLRICLLFLTTFLLSATSAYAQTTTPTPSASATSSPEVRAGNAIFGLLVLTAFALAGYFVAKWVRRNRRPRPPGPWFGGGFGRDREI